jgi:hypothetical protein
MHKLYEIRIHEPAVSKGLFPRPERWRYTNCCQLGADEQRGKPLAYGQGVWWFKDGRAMIYDPGTDGMVMAEIVRELDPSQAMDKDRFLNREVKQC